MRLFRNLLRTIGHSEWIHFGARFRLIRLFHNFNNSRSEEFTVNFYGVKYSGNFDTYIDWSVYYFGAYAKGELCLIRDLLVAIPEPVLLDIGANIGHHTLFASLHSKKVLSFEPYPAVAAKLEEKVKANKLANISLFKFALGNNNEILCYHEPSGSNTGTGSFLGRNTGGECAYFQVRVGDEVIKEIGINQINFIKIDTEGFEPFVLNGLTASIEKFQPIVFFEWTTSNEDYYRYKCDNLFPGVYSIYHFKPYLSFFKVFARRKYALKEINKSCPFPEGMLLAVPGKIDQHLVLNRFILK